MDVQLAACLVQHFESLLCLKPIIVETRYCQYHLPIPETKWNSEALNIRYLLVFNSNTVVLFNYVGVLTAIHLELYSHTILN